MLAAAIAKREAALRREDLVKLRSEAMAAAQGEFSSATAALEAKYESLLAKQASEMADASRALELERETSAASERERSAQLASATRSTKRSRAPLQARPQTVNGNCDTHMEDRENGEENRRLGHLS